MKLHCSGLIGIVCFLGLQGLAFAGDTIIIRSVSSGDWSSVSTWDIRVPGAPGMDQAEVRHCGWSHDSR